MMDKMHRGHYAVAGLVILVLIAGGIVTINARVGR